MICYLSFNQFIKHYISKFVSILFIQKITTYIYSCRNPES